uniref:Sulfotransferase n=1 Tax=Chenopodium quinoa TaxID=63459 RepID=A0A803KTF7_CHEQI
MTITQSHENEALLVLEKEAKKLEECLPKADFMGCNKKFQLVRYQDYWHLDKHYIKNTYTFQKQFQAQDSDFIISSIPKTGTTWLKSLLFAVVNRVHYPNTRENHPILSGHPHDLVYRLENGIYGEFYGEFGKDNNLCPSTLDDIPSPRLFSTHVPYTSLPESIKKSECRIIFITRNPLDSLVSQWHFYTKTAKNLYGEDFKPYSLEDYFKNFMDGKILYGPFFEHAIEYWKQSLERPHKVLFLKYEDLKDDPTLQLKRLAEFVGMPFSPQEEGGGVIKDIIELCSIKNLKELDVNKNGKVVQIYPDDYLLSGNIKQTGLTVWFYSSYVETVLS